MAYSLFLCPLQLLIRLFERAWLAWTRGVQAQAHSRQQLSEAQTNSLARSAQLQQTSPFQPSTTKAIQQTAEPHHHHDDEVDAASFAEPIDSRQHPHSPPTIAKTPISLGRYDEEHKEDANTNPIKAAAVHAPTMAERQLTQILNQLKSQSSTLSYADASSLLSKAKLLLLQLNALNSTTTSDPSLLALARDTYEQGALASIRAKNPDAFTRYVNQLSPFYELPPSALPPNPSERSKVTGLYLLLLLTQGRYAEFHSELEALSTTGGVDVEGDRYLGYPIRLERWLMEGSYDRVWNAMKKGEVPCEEFGVFSDVRNLRLSPPSHNSKISNKLTVARGKRRFLHSKFAPRLPAAANVLIPRSRYHLPSRCSSLTRKAPLSTSPRAEAGSFGTAQSTSRRRMQRRRRAKRQSKRRRRAR